MRTLGDEDDNEETEDTILRNNWGNDEQLKLDLVSKHEDVQVCQSQFNSIYFCKHLETKPNS